VTGTFDSWSKSERLEKKGDLFIKDVTLSSADEKIYYKVRDGRAGGVVVNSSVAAPPPESESPESQKQPPLPQDMRHTQGMEWILPSFFPCLQQEKACKVIRAQFLGNMTHVER